MRYVLLILFFSSALLISGCSSVVTRQFNGKIGNLEGNGHITAINSECRGFGKGPTGDGKYYAAFDLTPMGPNDPPTEFYLYFIFPLIPKGQIVLTKTETRTVSAWFFRSDKDYANDFFVSKNDEDQLLKRGGQLMVGRVAIKWESDADFVIGADLALPNDNSTWLRGEFVASTKTRLNAITYEWPAILLFQESK